ncbi:ArsR/SmtB family transcription factor [Halopiger aswanensis]|uniref:DNA-binding transcriptional ArsR family regulator n=1 Tax=Halopiger aswanensis TaxID=148449 RepID=A0A3R7GTK4_9EURY|nr:helix-turn-helix domain-containing protein [Halopiger aswanensis]RKD89117.1 DNA-binding transcriptional ArsR family regulator [Halopiger aswanensis]
MSQFDRTVGSDAESGQGADRDTGPEGDADTEPGAIAQTESQLLPADVFATLGNETRVDILRSLLELDADESPVSFTELFEAVDIEDSANFNYHLQQLTDHFIAQTDDGYEFRYPGRKVVSSIFSGTFTERAKLGFFPVDGSCYDCDGALQGWYVDDTLTIGCTDCGAIQVSYPFPTGGLDDRSTEELLQAFHHYVRHHYCLAADGVCPECTGTVESDLVRDPDADDQTVAVEHVCQRCGYQLQSTVGLTLLDNADVLVFHSKRGVDLNTAPFWRFDWCVSDTRTTIIEEEPLRVQLTLPCEGDELQVLLDETGSVLETAVVEHLPQ